MRFPPSLSLSLSLALSLSLSPLSISEDESLKMSTPIYNLQHNRTQLHLVIIHYICTNMTPLILLISKFILLLLFFIFPCLKTNSIPSTCIRSYIFICPHLCILFLNFKKTSLTHTHTHTHAHTHARMHTQAHTSFFNTLTVMFCPLFVVL